MNVNEIKTYYQDNGKWKECEFLSGEEMAQRATELLRENKRLNNIINELEKWFKEMSEYKGLGVSDERFYYQNCLNYLKELKEEK